MPGRSERDQANWWIRAVATFLSVPRVEHIGIYELKDLAPDKPAIGDAPNYHLGLFYADGRRKLAYSTIDLLTDLLDAGSLTVAGNDEVDVSVQQGRRDDVYRHMFVRPDGTRVLFVWTRAERAIVGVHVAPAQQLTEYGVDGRPLEHAGSPAQVLGALALSPGEPRIFRLR